MKRPWRLQNYLGDFITPRPKYPPPRLVFPMTPREIEIGRQSERDLIRGAEKEASENRQKRGE